MALPTPQSTSEGMICFFGSPLRDVHNPDGSTCMAASQEDLGGPRWAAKPGWVRTGEEVRVTNNPSTSVKSTSSDASQNFYFQSFSPTAQVPSRQGRMDPKVEASLTNAKEPMLRHKGSGQVHSSPISKFAFRDLEVNQPSLHHFCI